MTTKRSGLELDVPAGEQRTQAGNRGTFLPFLGAAFRRPHDVGTMLPSASRLAGRLAEVVPDGEHATLPPVVLEVGAGTGAITAALAARAGDKGTVIAVEKDPGLAGMLRERHPDVDVVAGDADTTREILAERGIETVDAVVSALPWTLFGSARRKQLLELFASVLAPEGVFTTACYSYGLWVPAARRFRVELDTVFEEVLATRTVWRNPPPAMTYACRRPYR